MMQCLNIERLRKKAAETDTQGGYPRLVARRKLELLEKAGYKCEQCGSVERLTVDHKVPVRILRRQQHTPWSRVSVQNCQILCVPCHDKKNKEEKK
mgnify:CR=1 FL=1